MKTNLRWKNHLDCIACISTIKIAKNSFYCLSQHLGTTKHKGILEESNVNLPLHIKQNGANDESDDYFVRRERYARKIVLSKEGVDRRPWADVRFQHSEYKFYCTLCDEFLKSGSIKHLRQHEQSDAHTKIFQRDFEKDVTKFSKSK